MKDFWVSELEVEMIEREMKESSEENEEKKWRY